MGSRSTLAGLEVPILGSDSVKWIEVLVPPTFGDATVRPSRTVVMDNSRTTCPPITRDYCSSISIGEPPTYIIWRIHKHLPHILELLEFCANKEFPKVGLQGLRIIFREALSPLIFLCKNEVFCGIENAYPYLLYALTVSGIANLLRLRTIASYASGSVIQPDDLLDYGLGVLRPITSAAATPSGCLVIGRNDGSLLCYQLATVIPSYPGFRKELRDDPGIGSLWGLMSRGRVSAVQDLVISMVHGKTLVFVLHTDGILRVWDLSSHSRLFIHNMNSSSMTGATLVRLWVGQVHNDSSIIPLAILCKHNLEISSEAIYVYSLRCNLGVRTVLLLEPSIQNIPMEVDGWIDVKLTSDKICILKSNGLVLHKLLHMNVKTFNAVCYTLQEDFVADQLFQGSEHSSDDLLLRTPSIFSSSKDHIVQVVSSIFLRRLLIPCIHRDVALHATLLDYNRHWSESDFQSLNADELKKEILSLIEHEGLTYDFASIICWWKNFFTRYLQNWCESNAPCGLLADYSTGTVGLVRKNSVSVFRSLEDV